MIRLAPYVALAAIACARTAPKVDLDAPHASGRLLACTKAATWKSLVSLFEETQGIPIETKDFTRGFLSSAEIREKISERVHKYRISATLSEEKNGTLVRIYKHSLRIENGRWVAVPSDFSYEAKLLEALQSELRCGL